MTTGALEQLLTRARGPMGPKIELDFGLESGPFVELGQMLSRINGFFLFNAGVQVFRAGEEGLGPELIAWNTDTTWKDTYGTLVPCQATFARAMKRRSRSSWACWLRQMMYLRIMLPCSLWLRWSVLSSAK